MQFPFKWPATRRCANNVSHPQPIHPLHPFAALCEHLYWTNSWAILLYLVQITLSCWLTSGKKNKTPATRTGRQLLKILKHTIKKKNAIRTNHNDANIIKKKWVDSKKKTTKNTTKHWTMDPNCSFIPFYFILSLLLHNTICCINKWFL